MTVAPLGAETSMDLNCTLKGQHMTGNQSAPNWMISSLLNMFQIVLLYREKYEYKNIFLVNTHSDNISTLKNFNCVASLMISSYDQN